ncbi:MAG: hypothetical protein CVV51_02310 [Spirochaetae bacterium HGW-Spirochaetae-7]|nr:MAG: hypothetical protein CVV51_02310 [Spirochaetae bacterium HGW-Spirochaetae-7]
MFRLIRKLFARPSPPPPPGSSPETLWKANFSSIEASRFDAGDDGRYGVSVDRGGLVLELKRGSLFAWSDAGQYRYADVSVEAEIEFHGPRQRSCCGIIVRKAEETSFVYILVSSDGEVRMDAVFNGEPRVMVPWIACPWAVGAETVVLNVVARGSRFVVMVNGRFALESDHDGLDSGGVAFAGQTLEAPASFGLHSFSVESRPLEVEVDYLRFARVVAADLDQRRRLADGLFSQGYYVPALVQLRRVGAGKARDKFMEAECLLRLELLGEAAEAIDACLAIDPTMDEAIEERYNLLYLRSDHARLRESLEADPERLAGSPRLANLLGHAYYNLGSWEKAAEAYGMAVAGDPTMPLYARNKAMALENHGDLGAAAAAWRAAAGAFYDQEAWDDAADCSRRLRQLGYEKTALDSLDGLVAYGRGDVRTAEAILGKLARKGVADAPASYIHGLILAARAKRAEATRSFRRAVELAPSVGIYRYRLAESLFVSGLPCDDEISAALETSPDDGWTANLAGQAALATGDADRAAALFARAALAMPSEPVPAVNLSEALSATGRFEEAVAALGDWPLRSAAAANRLGNVHASAGNLKEAEAAYRKACELGAAEPELPDYRVNLAAALIERGELAEAEDALRRAMEQRDDARAMMLMGDLTSEYGDFGRAELSYRAALQSEPGNPAILRRLADHYLGRRRWVQAEGIARSLEAVDAAQSARVRDAIRAATVETVACTSCGLSWELPRPTPMVSRSTVRGEPPDDSPAGSCPVCGKVFCVACRKNDLAQGRFVCPDCGERLNLNDDRVRYLVRKSIQSSAGD